MTNGTSFSLSLFIAILFTFVKSGESQHVFVNGDTVGNNGDTEQQLHETLRDLSTGDIVEVDEPTITLTRTLLINVSNVTFKGIGDREVNILCPENDNALIISADSVVIQSLRFSRCKTASAVVFDTRTSPTTDQDLNVEIRNVSFINNGALHGTINGSALKIEPCPNADCRRLGINITNSLFQGNEGQSGAAIWCQNCILRIRGSVFKRNEVARSGGAVYINGEESVLDVHSSEFIRNIAANSTQSSEDFDVASNSALFIREGGAIFASSISQLEIKRSKFIRNSGCYGGGAISFMIEDISFPNLEDKFFTIEDCEFLQNSATCPNSESSGVQDIFRDRLFRSGGALSSYCKGQVPIRWTIRNSNFSDNTALNGGAIYIAAEQDWSHEVINCSFAQNEAKGGGGGGILAVSSRLLINGSTFDSGTALYGGGVFVFAEAHLYAGPSSMTNAPTQFINNTALFGGGIQCNDRYSVELEGVIIRDNVAHALGGGMRCYDSGESVILRGVQFERNRARIGGGIMFTASANVSIDSYNGHPSIFRNNYAMIGGGFHFSPGHFFFLDIKLTNVQFIHNAVFSLQELRALANSTSNASTNLETKFVDFINSNLSLTELTLSDRSSVPDGHGGGLSLSLEQVPNYAVVEVVFVNVEFDRNRAGVGGGLSIYIARSNWNYNTKLHCFPAIFGVFDCHKFVFQNVSIIENTAQYAGGVFITEPKAIKLTCDHTTENVINTTLFEFICRRIDSCIEDPSSPDNTCTEFEDNRISTGGDLPGADSGTLAKALHVLNSNNQLGELASNNLLTGPCPNEADDCSEQERLITVGVRDEYNQTIVQGLEDAEMEVLLSSEYISGDTSYRAEKGIIKINNTKVAGIDVDSQLNISSVRDSTVFVEQEYSIRPCQIGEFRREELCLQCVPGQYGFDPNLEQCHLCVEHANCTGGAALVPLDGYWHSTPFSTQIHRCFYQAACAFPNRTKDLIEYYENTTRLENEWRQMEHYAKHKGEKPEFPDYIQCDEGYRGVLCGSCTEEYGRSANGGCEKCPEHKAVARSLVAIALMWTLIIIGLNSGITLASAKARIQLFIHDLHTRTANARRPPMLQRAPIVNSAVVERALDQLHEVSGNLSEIEDLQSRQTLTRHLVSTVQLTETLKILVNYLQVTSAALHLPVDWSGGMKGMLSVQAGFVGFASESIDVPFECNFPSGGNVHRSISAIWLRILSPLIVLFALVLLFTLFWVPVHLTTRRKLSVLEEARRKLGHRSWLTCVIVISIVTVHFSYIEMTRELLRTVNCIKTDEESNHKAHDKYTIASGYKVWVEDTSLKCFEGEHLATGVVGILGLFLGILVIVFIIVWLPLNRRHRKKQVFLARYWFIYQGYRKESCTSCWEAVILIRKALIAAVLVFSVHLGLTLQATLCVGILVLAHVLQVAFHPFVEEDGYEAIPEYFFYFSRAPTIGRSAQGFLKWNNSVSLNGLESASLVCSALFFFSAIVLNDSYTSELGKSLMTAVAFGGNFCFLLYVLFRLYAGLHGSLDLYLDHSDPAFFISFYNRPGPRSFVKKLLRVLAILYKQRFSVERRQDLEALSELELGSIHFSTCLDMIADDSHNVSVTDTD